MKDGDSPDTIVITYGRCNAALELVTDLMQVVPAAEWHVLARRMLDRELLADDQWWGALQRRRRRKAGKALDPGDIPSASTKLTAGHLLLAAVMGRDLEQTDDPAVDDLYHASGRFRAYDYPEAQRIAYRRSGGLCEAEGMHHRNCPGDDSTAQDQFVTHHRYPRERAKRDGLEGDPLVDHPSNLLFIWNGYTRKGAGGCHGRIHTERGLAHDLGHLCRDLGHVLR